MLTIYDLNNRDGNGMAKMVREVVDYEGFLSSARFIDDESVVTGSFSIAFYTNKLFSLTYLFHSVN